MGESSKIEWTDASWTPIRARNLRTGKVGWHCEHATTGCEHCYAEGFNQRFGTGLPFKPGHRKDIDLFLDNEMLQAPLSWRKPRMIFVCSMTDLFADFVSDEWIDRMFAVMALCPQHTFQVLTKRSERMRAYLSTESTYPNMSGVQGRVWAEMLPLNPDVDDVFKREPGLPPWPLPNVWLGVSAERQTEANARILDLLATPAAIRFVSAEPLIGPIDFERGGFALHRPVTSPQGKRYPGLDWVIVGGESGPRARPMHPDWARSIRDQCQSAGVSFFFKQWGQVVGKAKAGRLLDGRTWDEMPEVSA